MEDLAKGCIGTLIYLAISFGVDLLLAQMVVWTLSAYHINSGIWPGFLLAVTVSMLVASGTAGIKRGK